MEGRKTKKAKILPNIKKIKDEYLKNEKTSSKGRFWYGFQK